MSPRALRSQVIHGQKCWVGGPARYLAFRQHGATVRAGLGSQWSALNDAGDPVCSMWYKDSSLKAGLCNFKGGHLDCGDMIEPGTLIRIVRQDGYHKPNGPMHTTSSQALPTFWRAADRVLPVAGRSGHTFDWVVTRTDIPAPFVT